MHVRCFPCRIRPGRCCHCTRAADRHIRWCNHLQVHQRYETGHKYGRFLEHTPQPTIHVWCVTAKYDPDMNLKKYDTRLNGQAEAALKAKKNKSYTTFPFDKIKSKK
mmetsp:Transcript_23513/g.76014  ORF Transcript_23513/g.76014 Transcript_23513/m.76014 type:complete len:107 (-) Transcript_23513:326-646(-)|eukprot:scaffold11739_cov129-Isochrysis_galbana.AAC.9